MVSPLDILPILALASTIACVPLLSDGLPVASRVLANVFTNQISKQMTRTSIANFSVGPAVLAPAVAMLVMLRPTLELP